ncbi:ABC transporter permease [Parapedobacter sp.]
MTSNKLKFNFVDKQFEAKYRADQRAGLLFNLFAGIAIFISCLGLLGLSTCTARQRVKEIGIRKVLGASVGSIAQLQAGRSYWYFCPWSSSHPLHGGV